MQYTKPDYYNEFVCLADKCPNTCCAGWQIVIDEESQLKYMKYQQDGAIFGNRLYNGVDWNEGVFHQDKKKRCEFLNEENLCDIYSEAGKEMLCDTCRTYPRHIEEFEESREMSLCMSCPEAARIILGKTETIRFLSQEDQQEELYEEFDYFLFSQLMEARAHLLTVMQERKRPVYERMMYVLKYAKAFQMCIEDDELYRCEEIKDDLKKEMKAELPVKHCLTMQQIWRPFMEELEVLQEEWMPCLKASQVILYAKGQAEYERQVAAFEEDCPEWQVECEQLMVYWIFTYFAGAVYDDDVLGKMSLAMISTLLVRELAIAKYIENDQVFKRADLIEICMKYSREVEHADENLQMLEEAGWQLSDLFLSNAKRGGM